MDELLLSDVSVASVVPAVVLTGRSDEFPDDDGVPVHPIAPVIINANAAIIAPTFFKSFTVPISFLFQV